MKTTFGNKTNVNYELMHDTFIAALNRILAHQYSQNKKLYFIKYYSGHKVCRMPTVMPMTIEKAEDSYLHQVDILTKVYTRSVYKVPHRKHTLRVLDGVGYSGHNRIVCVAEDQGYNMVYHYGKNSHGATLVEQFHTSVLHQFS